MKQTLTIEFADDVLLSLGITPEQLKQEIPLLSAIKLYEMGRLSAGAAATLAQLPKPVFLSMLASYGVDTFSESGETLQEDLEAARGCFRGV